MPCGPLQPAPAAHFFRVQTRRVQVPWPKRSGAGSNINLQSCHTLLAVISEPRKREEEEPIAAIRKARRTIQSVYIYRSSSFRSTSTPTCDVRSAIPRVEFKRPVQTADPLAQLGWPSDPLARCQLPYHSALNARPNMCRVSFGQFPPSRQHHDSSDAQWQWQWHVS